MNEEEVDAQIEAQLEVRRDENIACAAVVMTLHRDNIGSKYFGIFHENILLFLEYKDILRTSLAQSQQ